MFRALSIVLFLAISATAANVRLYLKDGSYHLVREYQKLADRVRYYSVERADWEEIPLDMVDFKKTEEEVAAKDEKIKQQTKAYDDEAKAIREERAEIARVPMENGVYFKEGNAMKLLKQAEPKTVSNKRRTVLKVLSPLPVLSGKATIELDGPNAQFAVHEERPEFYFRPNYEERFAILRLTPTKAARVVQKWDIVPITHEIVEQSDEVEIFRRQLADGLYKIWPTKTIEPGEYAVVEFTAGKGNIQVWDFSVARR
jgi:hypothetical protein